MVAATLKTTAQQALGAPQAQAPVLVLGPQVAWRPLGVLAPAEALLEWAPVAVAVVPRPAVARRVLARPADPRGKVVRRASGVAQAVTQAALAAASRAERASLVIR